MKAKRQQPSASPSVPPTGTAAEDPFYARAEWVGPAMKQVVSREERRTSAHRGKTIRRPARIARTMES